MSKLWEGRLEDTSLLTDKFNSSISFDCRLFKEDIDGSIAHARMLEKQGIITTDDAEKIVSGLNEIKTEIIDGRLEIDQNAEDIHTFVEQELTKRIGDAGKKLHTARSRNDQVALDLRMHLKSQTDEITALTKNLIKVLNEKAKENINTVMPGYTHMQRAQPVTFAHHLLAYAAMFMRDISRFEDAKRRMNISPIGSLALAGTTYDTDRFFESSLLGFDTPCINSLDGVSDRDFCVDFISACALLITHLSRFAEEIVYWSGSEFGFVTISDNFSTGSSIMPQKKNPDVAELVRGKTGRVYGDLMGMLTVLKGLPLAYNKDMQEDKEFVFDSSDTIKACLEIFAPMIAEMTVNADNMRKAASKGFINATDCADYLTRKGIPFRDAYKITGRLVNECVKTGQTLESLPLEKYKEFSSVFDNDIYDAVNLENCVARRTSYGGPSPDAVKKQIEIVDKFLNE
ncbi:MAG: argininosuccinate lyase [Eubacteriales bacterium]|jgi:argininosuccinate lyase